MNTIDPIVVPGILETVGDVIDVIAPFKVGDEVYHANMLERSITKLVIRVVQISVSKGGQVEIRYNASDIGKAHSSGSWYGIGLYRTIDQAGDCLWS